MQLEGRMPLLQVRDFPADIYEEIKYKANEQNRTIAQQTIVLIKKGLGEEVSNKERRRLLFEEIKKNDIPEEAKAIDVAKWIREDRNR
jgi:hypothetical protein